jgi:hypothetical protein
VLALVMQRFGLDAAEAVIVPKVQAVPVPDGVDPTLANVLTQTRGRVMESQHYRIAPQSKDAFLDAMVDVRDARGRAGAVEWHLGEDVSDPEHWVEIWWMENWTDHLREAGRLSEVDRAALARAFVFQVEGEPAPQRRYLAVAPHRMALRT